jgi:hypothetical protein
MFRKSLMLAAASVALTACYHVSVVYNPPGPAQASAATVVDVPWSHGFIYGLVPPAEVNTTGKCTRGASKVEVEMSFVNGVAAVLTSSLYSPQHVTVTCR